MKNIFLYALLLPLFVSCLNKDCVNTSCTCSHLYIPISYDFGDDSTSIPNAFDNSFRIVALNKANNDTLAKQAVSFIFSQDSIGTYQLVLSGNPSNTPDSLINYFFISDTLNHIDTISDININFELIECNTLTMNNSCDDKSCRNFDLESFSVKVNGNIYATDDFPIILGLK